MKNTILILLIYVISLTLSSCYDSTEVDDLVYVIAIGIDSTENEEFEFTFQSAVPLNISSGIETSFSSSVVSLTLRDLIV